MVVTRIFLVMVMVAVTIGSTSAAEITYNYDASVNKGMEVKQSAKNSAELESNVTVRTPPAAQLQISPYSPDPSNRISRGNGPGYLDLEMLVKMFPAFSADFLDGQVTDWDVNIEAVKLSSVANLENPSMVTMKYGDMDNVTPAYAVSAYIDDIDANTGSILVGLAKKAKAVHCNTVVLLGQGIEYDYKGVGFSFAIGGFGTSLMSGSSSTAASSGGAGGSSAGYAKYPYVTAVFGVSP